jgi:hypothetical protein
LPGEEPQGQRPVVLTAGCAVADNHVAMTAGYAGPQERLRLYEGDVEATPGVERKGATLPYTSRNGHMFSFLDPTGSPANV